VSLETGFVSRPISDGIIGVVLASLIFPHSTTDVCPPSPVLVRSTERNNSIQKRDKGLAKTSKIQSMNIA